jgi:mono/diheme cytochrome c family protein
MIRTTLAIAAAVALFAAVPLGAQEQNIKLKDGPGKEAVEANCGTCHSLDYIPMNSPFLDRPRWDAAIKKMQGPFGAPITEADATLILEYLAKNYAP